jgi:hypothetical protein
MDAPEVCPYEDCERDGVVIGVAVDAQEGVILTIDVLESEQTETLDQWLQPILNRVGAEVLTTDDADAFKAVIVCAITSSTCGITGAASPVIAT